MNLLSRVLLKTQAGADSCIHSVLKAGPVRSRRCLKGAKSIGLHPEPDMLGIVASHSCICPQ